MDETDRDSNRLTSRGGLKVRLSVLGANLAFIAICVGFLATLRYVSLEDKQRFVMQFTSKHLLLGPLAFATLLAAWGPRHYLVRILSLMAFLALIRGALVAYHASGVPDLSWLSRLFLREYSRHLSGAMVAGLILVFVAVFRRLRIGPPELPPIRMTIMSLMLTSVILPVGFLIASTIRAEAVITPNQIHESLQSNREQVLFGALSLGSKLAACGYIGAMAALHWQARIVAIFLSMGFGLFAANLATKLGGMITSTELAIMYSTDWLIIISWVAVNVRILHHSGWPLMRR